MHAAEMNMAESAKSRLNFLLIKWTRSCHNWMMSRSVSNGCALAWIHRSK